MSSLENGSDEEGGMRGEWSEEGVE